MNKDQFQKARTRLNQSPKEFATTLGKSLRMVQYYETGDFSIPRHVEILILRLEAEKDFQEQVKRSMQ